MLTNESKQLIELEVRRVIDNRESDHQSYLQSSFKHLVWALGIIITATGICFYFLVGDSIEQLNQRIEQQIKKETISYQINQKVITEVIEQVGNAVENQVNDDITTEAIETEIVKQVANAVGNQVNSDTTIELIETKVTEIANQAAIDSANDHIQNTLKVELANLNLANLEGAIVKAALPQGSIVAFNRQSCPTGWSEFQPAYGHFIRGIDKSGKAIDPDGQRAPGHLQTDELKKHMHTLGDAGQADWSGRGYKGKQRIKSGNGSISTSVSGGSETRPKNIALLICEKS